MASRPVHTPGAQDIQPQTQRVPSIDRALLTKYIQQRRSGVVQDIGDHVIRVKGGSLRDMPEELITAFVRRVACFQKHVTAAAYLAQDGEYNRLTTYRMHGFEVVLGCTETMGRRYFEYVQCSEYCSTMRTGDRYKLGRALERRTNRPYLEARDDRGTKM